MKVMQMDIKQCCIDLGVKYKVNTMGLFGSRARGDFYEDSDYDFFMISDISLEDELMLEYELENIIGEKVDLVRLDDKTDKLFLKSVLNEGIVFFDDGAYKNLYDFTERFFIENSDFLWLRERDLIG